MLSCITACEGHLLLYGHWGLVRHGHHHAGRPDHTGGQDGGGVQQHHMEAGMQCVLVHQHQLRRHGDHGGGESARP